MFACVYSPGYDEQRRGASAISASSALIVVAQQFSPRYESRADLVVIDIRGLDRLFGHARAIGDELRREAADRGLRVHVAIAATQTAAMAIALARPGVVVVERGDEASAIAAVPIDLVSRMDVSAISAIAAFTRWGLRTLGDLAALPADELSARLGRPGLAWHAIARGVDVRPLVPDVEDERFESSLDLEWPIEGLEPLSFVLTRLLEPLALRLEQRDRGAAALHVELRLVTKDSHVRRLELPTPMRDVKTLRTLMLLDLEAHPPGAAMTVGEERAPGLENENIGVDRVSIVIEPTPARVWQHTLFRRPHPTPEQISTLLARLGALMGQDRIGSPVMVDSYRPGAFTVAPFATEHGGTSRTAHRALPPRPGDPIAALRRCRHPIPARVAADERGRPVTVTSDRRGFAGGSVLHVTGPWKTSGEWWLVAERAGQTERAGQAGWDRDEWDVALDDGGSYRVFRDYATGGWFIDAILD